MFRLLLFLLFPLTLCGDSDINELGVARDATLIFIGTVNQIDPYTKIIEGENHSFFKYSVSDIIIIKNIEETVTVNDVNSPHASFQGNVSIGERYIFSLKKNSHEEYWNIYSDFGIVHFSHLKNESTHLSAEIESMVNLNTMVSIYRELGFDVPNEISRFGRNEKDQMWKGTWLIFGFSCLFLCVVYLEIKFKRKRFSLMLRDKSPHPNQK